MSWICITLFLSQINWGFVNWGFVNCCCCCRLSILTTIICNYYFGNTNLSFLDCILLIGNVFGVSLVISCFLQLCISLCFEFGFIGKVQSFSYGNGNPKRESIYIIHVAALEFLVVVFDLHVSKSINLCRGPGCLAISCLLESVLVHLVGY